MSIKVAIVGSGISGLAAAHGVGVNPRGRVEVARVDQRGGPEKHAVGSRDAKDAVEFVRRNIVASARNQRWRWSWTSI